MTKVQGIDEAQGASNAQEILEKYDREQAFRKDKDLGWVKLVVTILAVGLTLFQLYTAFFGQLQSQLQRAPHYRFGLGLSSLSMEDGKARQRRPLV